MTLTSPIRDSDQQGSQPLRLRRALWLVGLSTLIPGSAQLLAGDNRLGRFAVGTTLALWVTGTVSLLLFALWRPIALSLATNSVVLLVLATALTVADNGLAFTAVAERAGPFWSGRALGVQNTAQYVAAALVPPVGP